MFSWKGDKLFVSFLTCLEPPDLSQCLNNVQPARYNRVLEVKCYAPGNPPPDVTCQLWDENNVVLGREGRYCYVLHICCHNALLSNSIIQNWPLIIPSVLTWGVLEKEHTLLLVMGKDRSQIEEGLTRWISLHSLTLQFHLYSIENTGKI